jgi:protein SCO1
MLTKRINAFLSYRFFFFIACLGGLCLFLNNSIAQEVLPKTASNGGLLNGTLLTPPKPLTTFKMTNDTGHSFTEKDLKNHWSLLFFGFTQCGFVCPTSLAALNGMYKILETELPPNQLPQVIMVSVDPERDSVSRMHSYVQSFNPHFIGLRGSLSQTQALEKQMNIMAVKLFSKDNNPSHYSIDHSAHLVVVDPQGAYTAILNFPPKAEILAKDYKFILQKTSINQAIIQ